MGSSLFDFDALTTLAVNTPASVVNLSGLSLQIILSASALLEDMSNWAAPGEVLTTERRDEIEAAVALMESEIMSAVPLGTMAEQDADAVAITGGTINGISALTALMLASVLFERDGAAMALLLQSYGNIAQTILRRANGSKATPTAIMLNDILGNYAFSGYVNGAFSTSRAILQAVSKEAWTATAQGTALRFYVTALAATVTALAAEIHPDKRLQVLGDLDHDGAKAGFRGATEIVAPVVTGSRGGNAALASALTALASQGLIVDSTTV